MKHSKAVLLVLLLALLPGIPQAVAQQTDNSVAPQDTVPREEHGLELEQNYPNPFSDETRIPLVLGQDLFEEGRPVVVTVRIYNVFHRSGAGSSREVLLGGLYTGRRCYLCRGSEQPGQRDRPGNGRVGRVPQLRRR